MTGWRLGWEGLDGRKRRWLLVGDRHLTASPGATTESSADNTTTQMYPIFGRMQAVACKSIETLLMSLYLPEKRGYLVMLPYFEF